MTRKERTLQNYEYINHIITRQVEGYQIKTPQYRTRTRLYKNRNNILLSKQIIGIQNNKILLEGYYILYIHYF